MKRCIISLAVMVGSLLVIAGIGRAQTTYEDPQGRFAVDLPKGWKFQPLLPAAQTNDLVSDFQGDGKSISIVYCPGIDDPAKLIQQAKIQFRFLNVVFEGDVKEMTLNGHPARQGVLKTPLDPGMVILCGGVALGENGLYYFSVMRDKDIAIKGSIEKSLVTIRLPGEAVTGAGATKSVSPPPPEASSPTPWKSDLVSLTLPPGWMEKPLPRGAEKEAKGLFMNENLPGASLIVVCYKGWGMTMAKALDAGIKTMTIPVPDMKPVEFQEMELGKRKIYFVVLKGMGAGGGTEVELASVITVTKADKCYVNLLLTGSSSLLPELKSQSLEITKTVK